MLNSSESIIIMDLKKQAFEIKGDINRNDFGLDKNFNNSKEKFGLGKNLKLVANLEFSI